MYLHKDDKELDNNADETTDSYKKNEQINRADKTKGCLCLHTWWQISCR